MRMSLFSEPCSFSARPPLWRADWRALINPAPRPRPKTRTITNTRRRLVQKRHRRNTADAGR